MENIEFVVYQYMMEKVFPQSDINFLKKVLSGKNVLHFRDVVATVLGRRMSGEVFTSLGNGISNLMLALFLCEERGIICDGFVEGDDGLFALSEPLHPEDWAELGFTVKMVNYFDDPGKAHFCGMIFSSSMQIIRDPRRFMEKFGWTHSAIDGGDKVMWSLLYARCLSTLYETSSCPIIGKIATVGAKIAGPKCGYKPRFEVDGYHKPPPHLKAPPFQPTYDTRLLFEEKFGISVSEQIWCEREIEQGREFNIAHSLSTPFAEFQSSAQVIYEDRFVGGPDRG